MGTWGTGIRQDDFVCDVQDAFKDYLKDGKTLAEATAAIHEQFHDASTDSDDDPLFWIALADIQWAYGGLDPQVLNRVDEIIDSETGMEQWREAGEKAYRQRQAALAKFRDKISVPNPKPSRPPKRVSRKPRFTAGDCLAVKLDDGNFGAALVLATNSSDPEYPSDLVGELDYLSLAPPPIEVFQQRNWLKLTHHSWEGKLNINWYVSTGFNKMKPRLEIVGNIPILETDPRHSDTYSGWQLLGAQIVCQRLWDAEHEGDGSQANVE